jgi:protein-tyrosine phosphatase
VNAEGPTSGSILVVCTANICRSPLAELHLREVLTTGPHASTRITSAGVRGLDGEAMCATARRALDDPEHGRQHVAREVTGELVGEADLVLTMEKEQRGAIARLSPGQQGKVFTLREAVAMLEAIRADGDVPDTVPELVERMRALRGIVRPPLPEAPPAPRFRLFRRSEPEVLDDGLSVEDGHNIDSAAHARTAEEVRALTARLGAALLPV